MVGSALVGTGDRVDNDNYKPVGVMGAYNLPLVQRTLETVTDAVMPGALLMHATGAGGEDKVQLCDDKDPRGIAFSECDFKQISTCALTSTYTAGDEIPIYFINMNPGAILRNIQIVDPGGNVNATTYLTSSSGTQGSLDIVTEATLQTGSSAGGIFQTLTLGTNAAAGTFILPRLYGKTAYYVADPNAAYQDVIYVVSM